MSTTITIQDRATRDLQRAEGVLTSEQLAYVGARAVGTRLQDHFQDLERSRPNKRGWRRQHFWGGARRSVQTPRNVAGAKVVVSITRPGIALLYFGGVVRPIVAKMLTIPAVEEAYGERARERSDLILAQRVNPDTGRLQLCLVEAEQTRVALGPKSKKTGRRRFRRTESAGGKVIYWLARQTRIPKDPSVLPTQAELEQAASSAIASSVQRIEQRRGGAA